MAIEIRPVNPHFVAGIGGIDLSKSVDRPVVAAISEAIDRYAVVVFRDQRLDDTQLRDFASKFGALEIGRGAARGGQAAIGASGDRRYFKFGRRRAAAPARRPAAARQPRQLAVA